MLAARCSPQMSPRVSVNDGCITTAAVAECKAAGGRFAARGPVICRDTREAPTRSFARTIDSNAMATRVEWARLTREFVMTNRLA